MISSSQILSSGSWWFSMQFSYTLFRWVSSEQIERTFIIFPTGLPPEVKNAQPPAPIIPADLW
jgi:hypothetical protein